MENKIYTYLLSVLIRILKIPAFLITAIIGGLLMVTLTSFFWPIELVLWILFGDRIKSITDYIFEKFNSALSFVVNY